MALDFRRVVVLVFVAVLVAGTAIGSRRFAVLLPASEIEAVRLLESARPDRPGKAAPHHAAQSTATPEVVKPGRRQFTVYRAPSGELVCREATAEEIRERQSIDPQTRGLRRINHFELDKSASSQAPEASNLIIVLRGTQQLQQNAAATAAFNRAAQNWENVIMSPVTIYIDVDFGPTDFGDPWPDNVLGATGSPSGAFSYQAVRTALMAQANSEGDATKFAVFSSLPPVTLPTDLGDGSGVDLSDSIARAIGLLPATAQPANDASQIAFNSNNTFDFDPSNGITANAIDFEAVATHEIGHALGFDSDGGLNLPRPTVWDLYRFRTGTTASTFPSAQRIITVGGSPDPLQFDFIPGNPELGLSTGGPTGSDALGGDGWQSSHWKHVDTCGGTIGIMDPAIPEGCRRTITSNDQLALGSFGYNLTNNNGAPAAASPTPPANDNFANAQTITGCSGSAGGTSFGATSESGEPSHDPSDATSLSPSRSIWFQWQAPFSTATTITTLGSDFDTVVAVYTGSAVGSLTRVAFNDDQVNGSVRTSKLTFNPIAGTTYKIAVDGWGRDAGTVKLNWDGCPTSTPSPTPTPTPTPSPSPTPTPTPDPPCNGIFAVTDNGDADDANLGDGLCLTAGGACTLRAAVQQSNAMPKCGPVNVNLQGRSGTITLGSALGVITHGTTFNGPGADRLTIQRSSAAGTPPFNIFVINFGVGVSISGITISNGVGATNAGGGAIHNFGILTLANSAISGNQSLDGGGGGIVNDS
ncbi:MAG TPA: NF038122 family metalloprotease, partial [Pyrinomonadaceae bacterium]|nr:NF038122 family metalloprotease [Pyrinomonadaceae bacterium]